MGRFQKAGGSVFSSLDPPLAQGGGNVGHILVTCNTGGTYYVILLKIGSVLPSCDIIASNEGTACQDRLIRRIPTVVFSVDHTVIRTAVGTDIEEIVIPFKSGIRAVAAIGTAPANLLNTAGDQVKGADVKGIGSVQKSACVGDLSPLIIQKCLPFHKGASKHIGKGLLRLNGRRKRQKLKLEQIVFVQEVAGIHIVGNHIRVCLVPVAPLTDIIGIGPPIVGMRGSGIMRKDAIVDIAPAGAVLQFLNGGPIKPRIKCFKIPGGVHFVNGNKRGLIVFREGSKLFLEALILLGRKGRYVRNHGNVISVDKAVIGGTVFHKGNGIPKSVITVTSFTENGDLLTDIYPNADGGIPCTRAGTNVNVGTVDHTLSGYGFRGRSGGIQRHERMIDIAGLFGAFLHKRNPIPHISVRIEFFSQNVESVTEGKLTNDPIPSSGGCSNVDLIGIDLAGTRFPFRKYCQRQKG